MSEHDENVVVTLVDENDESFDAELLDSIMYDGHVYNFFIPVEEKEKEEPLVIILEYIEEGGIVAAEWSENFAELLALEQPIRVDIQRVDEDTRRITIEGANL